MTTSKVTVRSQFEAIREILADGGHDDLVAFVDSRLEQLAKKSASPATRKPTAKQIENEGLKAGILAWMEGGMVYTAADIAASVPSVAAAAASTNRVAALLRQLVNDGSVVKTTDKGKTYYGLA